uniref:G-patch domain-containing protein n=1 Tax=Panagrolaimus sp. JU765 TaxID=591449 RepID=A0AC34R1T0_9BILA
MSILAAPRYKKKIAPDPQNLKWKNDDNKIGQKMMEKMGWKDGKGLGKDEQGMKNNIKLKANYTQKGLKCGEEEVNVDKTWMSHHDEFSVLLEKLKSKKAVVEDESSDTEEDE